MWMHRYLATVYDMLCLDVPSCLLRIYIYIFLIGMVLLKLKVLLFAGKKPPKP